MQSRCAWLFFWIFAKKPINFTLLTKEQGPKANRGKILWQFVKTFNVKDSIIKLPMTHIYSKVAALLFIILHPSYTCSSSCKRWSCTCALRCITFVHWRRAWGLVVVSQIVARPGSIREMGALYPQHMSAVVWNFEKIATQQRTFYQLLIAELFHAVNVMLWKLKRLHT